MTYVLAGFSYCEFLEVITRIAVEGMEHREPLARLYPTPYAKVRCYLYMYMAFMCVYTYILLLRQCKVAERSSFCVRSLVPHKGLAFSHRHTFSQAQLRLDSRCRIAHSSVRI